MSWFARFYDLSLADVERHGLSAMRRALLAGLGGTVVEVGAGTGLNLPWYPDAVDRLVLVEPDAGMRRQLDRKVAASGRSGVEISSAHAERLPLDDAEADAAVGTLVLCSVADPAAAARELFRVVRPGGTLRFLEHGPHDHGWRFAAQRAAEPVWKHLAGGCHLTRRAADVLVGAGFELRDLERTRLPRAPFLVSPAWTGTAVRPG